MSRAGADASVRAHAMSRQASALRAARLAQRVFIDAAGTAAITRILTRHPSGVAQRRGATQQPERSASAAAG